MMMSVRLRLITKFRVGEPLNHVIRWRDPCLNGNRAFHGLVVAVVAMPDIYFHQPCLWASARGPTFM